MAGRGPRLGGVTIIRLPRVVLAFLATMMVPGLGLPAFLVITIGIAVAAALIEHRLPVQLVTHRDVDAFTKREELTALGRIYGLLPDGDMEILRARLHDFVEWQGRPGERIRVSARVLVPFLGPRRVKPIRVPTPAEVQRIASREELKRLPPAPPPAPPRGARRRADT